MKFLHMAAGAALICLALLQAPQTQAGDAKTRAICSTYPIYQIARNVVEGSGSLELELLLPPGTGCPHDYTITPQDLKKLSKAEILIINGLKMEPFIGAAVKSAKPSIRVIDSSEGVKDTLNYTGDEIDRDGAKKEEDDEHSGVNPHLFASPRMAAKLAMNIAAGLAKCDPKGASLYEANAKAFAARLEALGAEFSQAAKGFPNKRLVAEHGIFDYLARDAGMEISGVIREYEAESQAPSAAAIIKVVKHIRERKVGAIVAEPQYPDEIGASIAREAGIPLVKLDPVASGPEKAPLDYYETAMKANLKALKAALAPK